MIDHSSSSEPNAEDENNLDSPSKGMVTQLLTAEQIYRNLGRRSFIKRVFVFDLIDSTNSYAKKIIGSLDKHPTLIFAERQTDGRGRFHRRWESEEGKNLTFSIIARSRMEAHRMGLLPLCTAELVARAIQETLRVSVETKWPNDLLLNGKKLCGILLESASKQDARYVIVGVGLNVNQQAFPANLNATSLFLETGKTVDRKRLLHDVVNKLQWLAHVSPETEIDAMLRKWKERCTMFGKTILLQLGRESVKGLAKNVAPDGSLIVRVGDADRKIYAGDVTIAET